MVGRDHVLLSRGGTLCHQLAQPSPPEVMLGHPSSKWIRVAQPPV